MDKRDMSAAELLEHLYRGLSIEPDADITAEMDARALRELVQNNEPDRREPAPVVTGPAEAESGEDHAAAAEARRAKARLALGFSVVLTSAIVAGALYESPNSGESATSFMRVALVGADRANESQTFASTEAGTVLFVNPFDETEVFEFPPGTSEHEARDTVAGYLLKRAMDRQAHLR